MTIQLLKNKVPVLNAYTDHRIGNSTSNLPVIYEGDTSLLPAQMNDTCVYILESIFSLLARKHGFEMGGDYEDVMIKHNLRP